MLLKSIFIIAMVSFLMIGILVPNISADATRTQNSDGNSVDSNASGIIILSENEFKLFGGTTIIVPVIVEMNDFIHKPTLEIIHNDVEIQNISFFSQNDTFQTVIGLNDNWDSGTYKINLIYQTNVLDTVSFVINRDNEVVTTTIINEPIFKTIEPFISITPSVVLIENSSFETLSILGNVSDSRFGNKIILETIDPDGNITYDSGYVAHDGAFTAYVFVDKTWIDGKYTLNAQYLDGNKLSTFFTVENILQSTILEESKLIGTFAVSSETSHDYTILGISGNVDTDESTMILQITNEGIVMFEDTLSLDAGLFETSTVLYDYALNKPWAFGDYEISGLIGDDSFHSDTFTLDEQSFSVFNISDMNLFLNFENGVEKMVDSDEIIISYGEQKQIVLSGILENYSSGSTVDVHLVDPDGNDTISSIHASSNGSYYMPIIIDDSWVSGSYNAYVTYLDFIDNSSFFKVVNNAMISKEIILEKETTEIILQDLKHYSITLDSSQSVGSVHYTAVMDYYSTVTPILISLNDVLLREEFTHVSKDGLIDYYLLLDETWVSGNYTVSYVAKNVSIPIGTFEIFNNYIVEDVAKDDAVKEKLTEQYLTLDKSLFKSSSHVVEYLQFSGRLADDSTKTVSILLDGNLQTMLPVDSEGSYAGVISLGDNLDSGFHNLSISSDNAVESAEFLIATNHYISLDGDLEIFRNTIAESGGEISVFLSKMVPDFVPSEVQYVVITIEGDDYYKKFSVMPKSYGFYSQNFMLDGALGIYDVSVKYGDKLIESYQIDVLLPEPEWIKSHTTSWLNGEITDYSYFKKIVLMLDDDYVATPNVTSPEWFSESADKWMQGLMDDDSFKDAILFLAENRLL